MVSTSPPMALRRLPPPSSATKSVQPQEGGRVQSPKAPYPRFNLARVSIPPPHMSLCGALGRSAVLSLQQLHELHAVLHY